MENVQKIDSDGRLAMLQQNLVGEADVCSSGGVVAAFPQRMTEGFVCFGIGIIVCHEGDFDCRLSDKDYTVGGGQSVFISEGEMFRVGRQSDNLRLSIVVYKSEPIRYVLGTMVQSVNLYVRMSPVRHSVWHTGNEADIAQYIALISPGEPPTDDYFAVNERKLLLLSLTYKLCMIFSKIYLKNGTTDARRTQTFLKLIRLIDRYYMTERGVAFYADKMFLSAKYLSELSKMMCGYTVQELVFKAITRRAMAMLDSSGKTVAEISDEFNFPNPSSFGTFFRKQTGMSPQRYRERM